MTKISGYPQIEALNSKQATHANEAPAHQKSQTEKTEQADDSVIADLAPELGSAAAAEDLLRSLAAQLEQDPERAVTAQGRLDEDKVRALLDED